MTENEVKQPATAFASPRFCNSGNFMRMERRASADGLDFAIYGIPFDTGSSYRSGSRFGPQGIRNISVMMKPNNPVHEINILDHLKGADLGDVNVVPGYILPTYEAIEEFTSSIIDAGALPIALGGDHSITLPELRAIARKHGPVSLVHFDSHADINDQVFGQLYNHGTPFRRAHEEGLIDTTRSIQVGMRGSLYDLNEFRLAAGLGFTLIPTHEVRAMGLPAVVDEIKRVVGGNKAFLTFDIDFIDPAFAPGTGTPEVGGYSTFEAISLIRGLTGIDFVGFDVVEVAPPYDVAEITSLAAANLVFEFLSLLAVQRRAALGG